MNIDRTWKVRPPFRVCGSKQRVEQSFYEGSRTCVIVGSDVSEWFLVKVGLVESYVMSLWLFKIYNVHMRE